MTDKDEFKFDDDDAFPETDLSDAFSEGEQSAPEEPEYPMTIEKTGGSRTRILLLVLLLVLAGGGAAYYYLMMEEPAPPPPKKVVAAPKPAPAPAPVAAPTPASPATVGTPPSPPAAPPAAAPAVKPEAVTVPPPPPPVAAAAPAPTLAVPAVPAQPVAAAVPPPAKPEVKPSPPLPPAAKLVATSGPWLVEAGTYVNASELKAVQQKIRRLGYEPQVSTLQRPVRMTRLRIGSYPESEIKGALAYARGIAAEAFALRSGETFTLYAGTFTSAENIRQMTERFSGEGVQVEQEPIEVNRTISLVRFGGFPDQATAEQFALKARRAGIVAEVIKSR
jgi:cell division septation protein DedD